MNNTTMIYCFLFLLSLIGLIVLGWKYTDLQVENHFYKTRYEDIKDKYKKLFNGTYWFQNINKPTDEDIQFMSEMSNRNTGSSFFGKKENN